jgi:hypothetical protein
MKFIAGGIALYALGLYLASTHFGGWAFLCLIVGTILILNAHE